MNIFDAIPDDLAEEQVTDILCDERVRIKRILSKGHTAPTEGWFDQEDNEWVMVLEGASMILFEDGTEHQLDKGDYLYIPAHTKHRVVWTDPDRVTVWLAVHFDLELSARHRCRSRSRKHSTVL